MTLQASVGGAANDLAEYGEAATSTWIETCTDEEFVAVCNCAEFLLYYGAAVPSGGSMMIAKALALGAVYVRERVPRPLTRSRRDRTRSTLRSEESMARVTDLTLATSLGDWAGVGDDFIDFWAVSPAAAHAAVARARELRPPAPR